MTRTVSPYGRHGLLVDCTGTDDALGLRAAVSDVDWVASAVTGARTVLVITTTPPTADHARVLAELPATTPAAGRGREHVVEVHYDGDDLAEVAGRLDRDPAAVVTDHTTGSWAVAFCGFAPGFGYLRRPDSEPDLPRLVVPRRDSPRTVVPAGAVGLAGPWSGVYPRPGPGGWQLIGHTHHRFWDSGATPPATVAPGDRVRFVDAGAPCRVDHRTRPSDRRPGAPDGRAAPSGVAGAPGAVRVLDPGPSAVFEDAGRPGLAGLGVTGSGPADRIAARRANRLVGNPEPTTVIESLLGGLVLTNDSPHPLRCAVTGADVTVLVDDRPHPTDASVTLRPGATLRLTPARTGLRSYLAVRGGLVAPRELGSSATDVLAGLGPEPIVTGQVIMIGTAADHEPAADAAWPRPVDDEIPVTIGPRDDWFAPAAVDTLLATAWQVAADSDRVATRLSGPVLERSRQGELDSEPVIRGAIQVPPSGQPLVFGADHPTTGGYPVIGCVVDDGTDRLAQRRPGDRVRFRRVD